MKNQNSVCLFALATFFAFSLFQCDTNTHKDNNPNASKSTKTIAAFKTMYAPIVLDSFVHMYCDETKPNEPCYSSKERGVMMLNYFKKGGELNWNNIVFSIMSKQSIRNTFNQASDTTKLLIKVTDIDNPNKAIIEWLKYDKKTLTDSTEQLTYLFVFERERFDGHFDHTQHDKRDGMYWAADTTGKQTDAIGAFIGIDSNGKYLLFLNSISLSLLNKSDAGGNHGGDAGIHIPPGGN